MTVTQTLILAVAGLTFLACQPSPASPTKSGLADASPASAQENEAGAPNVLLITASDLGWNDLHCYGSPLIQSDNLDALARDGVQFMQAYAAAPVGTPSRLAWQTGLRPDRLPNGLQADHETIGELAHRAGYFTAHIGRWGLGGDPTHHGYDRTFAASDATRPDRYYHPFFHDSPFPELRRATKDGDYLPDALTDHALQLMREWKGAPWLISLNFYAPQAPVQGRADWVNHYRELIAATHWRRYPTVEYAAMVSALDANVGRLVHQLRTDGLLDNTLIVFTSDNGGLAAPATPDSLAPHTPPTDNGILRGGKGDLTEGGLRVPFIVHFPSRTTTTTATDAVVWSADLYPTLADLFSRNDYSPTPDGQSLLPRLAGKEAKARTLNWSHEGQTAERNGWEKTIVRNDSTFRYDLRLDPGEERELE